MHRIIDEMQLIHLKIMDLAAIVMMLVLCRYCSAQVGGCTPPAGSNLISGNNKLSNNIPAPERGILARELFIV